MCGEGLWATKEKRETSNRGHRECYDARVNEGMPDRINRVVERDVDGRDIDNFIFGAARIRMQRSGLRSSH